MLNTPLPTDVVSLFSQWKTIAMF